jgi:hypothetical protein
MERETRHALLWNLLIAVAALLIYSILAALVHLGFTYLPWLTLLGGLVGMGWTTHTLESKGAADDFRLALVDCGLSDKAAALSMGISEPQLSRQLAGLEMLSAWRMASLPPAFHVAYAKRRLARFGDYSVLEDGTLRELVKAVHALARPSISREVA